MTNLGKGRDAMTASDTDPCECDRPDEADNPHRHTFDVACVYWIAGRPDLASRRAAFEGRLPLTAPDA